MARRSPEASKFRALYQYPRWCGPHGVWKQAFLRDLYTCQRCRCIVIAGDRDHPRAAVAHHKMKHRGDPKLSFDLENVETVCKRDHDTLIQKEEARGSVIGSDINGRSLDPQHPWNR